jgi:hypothetical protein
MYRIAWLVVAPAAVMVCVWAASTFATPQLLTEAAKQGLPAQDCQYCHVSRMPQKASYTPDDLNDRGKWLMATKGKQGAKDVKAEWLKQYPAQK